ncbi:uncharacterized protein [Diadema antillarum]|uniref:uncharacterized protein n=1 Tax=Diadema antillarum TaxID=105358 RepID=UPI003A88D58A
MARNFQRVHIYLPMLLMITVAMKVNADCTLPTGDEYAGTAFDPELDIYPSGTFLRMSCIQGTPRDGSSVSFCLGNAWQQSLLTCYANCDPPNSRNGAAYEPSMTSYTEGTTITYSCTNGNDLIGTDQATCRDGVWDPPPVIGNPSCSVCTVPSGGDDDNTLFVPVQSEYEPDDSVEMSCRDGTTGEGASNSVCDGESWEPELLICYADCEAPDVNVDVTYQPIQNAYTHGDVLIFSCLNGNNLRGDNETVCTNGAWEPATTTESPSCAGITTILPTTAPPTEDAVTTLTTSETDSVTSAATEAGVSTSATPNPETETNAGFSSGTASVFTTEPQDGTDMGSTTDTPDATEAELTTQVTDEPDIGSTTEIPVETMTSSLTTELPDSTGLTSEPVSGTETDLTSALNSGTESSDRTDSATESELTSQSDGETDATFSTTGTAGEIISGMTTAIPGTTELGLSSASGPGILDRLMEPRPYSPVKHQAGPG